MNAIKPTATSKMKENVWQFEPDESPMMAVSIPVLVLTFPFRFGS